MDVHNYKKIEINHSDNIIINIKQASENDVDEILPGYVNDHKTVETIECKTCWNCSHDFSGQFVSIPLKYDNKVFYIYGHFCNYKCAARFIFDTFNDNNKWNIYSLLNLYYNVNCKTISEVVKPAPSKLMLKKFGGSMEIDEYRENNNIYNLYLPPIVPIEHCVNKTSDIIDIKNNKSNYKLFRKKGLTNKNNIYNTMNLNC